MRRSHLLPGLALVVGLVGGAADPAQTPPNKPEGTATRPPLSSYPSRDEEGPPEAGDAKAKADGALRRKGLRRDGVVYVLEREDAVQDMLVALDLAVKEGEAAILQSGPLERSAAQIRETVSGLVQQKQALIAANEVAAFLPRSISLPNPGGSKPSDLPNAQELDRLVQQDRANGYNLRLSQIIGLENRIADYQYEFAQVQMNYNRLSLFVASKRAEVMRIQASLEAFIREVGKRYQDLGADPEVRAALAELNRGSARRYALGPRDEYKANLRRLAASTLSAKGFTVKKGGKVVLGVDTDMKTARFLVETYRDDLGRALFRQKSLMTELASRRGKELQLAADEARLSGLQPPAPASRSNPDAELKTVRTLLARARQERADCEKSLGELEPDIAAKREGFIESVRVLRMAHDARQKKKMEMVGDRQVGEALADLQLKKGRAKSGKASSPPPDKDLAFLETVEKEIRVSAVPIEPDRTSPWVIAAVNDQPGRKFVLDPSADMVRVSESFAAEVKIESSATSPTTTVALSDGQTLSARLVTIRVVKVGAIEARDVPCLILLGNFAGPPVLGASFLSRFVSKVDEEANTLTLTQVNVPPNRKPAATRPKDVRAGVEAPRAGP